MSCQRLNTSESTESELSIQLTLTMPLNEERGNADFFTYLWHNEDKTSLVVGNCSIFACSVIWNVSQSSVFWITQNDNRMKITSK